MPQTGGKRRIEYSGKHHVVKGGMVPVGQFVKRFLCHVCHHLDIPRTEWERRLGVSPTRLGDFAKPLDDKSKPVTRDLRRKTVLTICLCTNQWARQLALDPNEDWVADIDSRLKEMGFRPSKTADTNLRLRVGERDWNRLRRIVEKEIAEGGHVHRSADLNSTAGWIRHLIATSVLTRGDEVDVLGLVDRIDQKPSVVQAALQALADEQIVESVALYNGRERFKVAQVTADAGREIMRLRMLIEPELIRVALSRPERRARLVAELKRCLNAMQASATPQRMGQFIDADVAFHMAFTTYSTYIPEVLRNLLSVINTALPGVTSKKQLQQDALRHHKAICDTIASGGNDLIERAVAQMVTHLQSASRQMFG